jgi:hypothetical protein
MAEVATSHTLDTSVLSSFLDIDQPGLQSIVDSAAHGIIFLLQQVQAKATEFEELRNTNEVLRVSCGTCVWEWW